MSHPVKVATLSALPPGTGRQVHVGDQVVAVFNVGGTIHAIGGSCTHRGGPLGEGRLDGSIVTCPWHGSRFDVTTGAVLNPPAARNAEVYGVSVDADAIVVELPDRT
jgi:3-phenylpropionate/trans-cinnamate dioxygenase ferredoxin component